MHTHHLEKIKMDAKVKVTTRALEARMRRHLQKENLVLRKCKVDSRWYHDLGDYYAVNENNSVRDTHIPLEAWAREAGVLKPYETVEG